MKNHFWNSVGQLFNETGKLISEQTEITGVTINFKELTWMSTSLLCSRACRITNAKTYIFSDSVLCVGKMGDGPIATWRSKNNWYSENNHFKKLNRIDGTPTKLEWETFPGMTTLDLLEKIQSLMRDLHFVNKIIFMSMYTDSAWQEKGNKERCQYNSKTIADHARRFPRGHWSFLESGSEKKWYGTCTDKPDGSWDQIAENMMTKFSNSGHSIFRASRAIERGELRIKEHGKKSIHFNGSDENIELLLRTVISADHLCLRRNSRYMQRVAQKILGLQRNLQHLIIWQRWKFLPTSLLQKIRPLGINSGKRRRSEEKVSLLLECKLFQSILVQFKDIQEVLSILQCKTMYCYRKVSPSIFITSVTEKN